jgi:hypothetical protein
VRGRRYGHGGGGSPAAPWLTLSAAAVAGVAVVLGLACVVGKPAFIAGPAYAILVLPLVANRIRPSRGSGKAVVTLVLGFLVLTVLGPLNTADWYLAIAGKSARAVLAAPARHEDRDSRTVTCRVRLPGGGVRQVDHDDGRCAAETGGTTDVVYDPSGWFAPHLGTPADLSARTTGVVAGVAFAVMLLAPLTVAVVGGRGPRNEAGR